MSALLSEFVNLPTFNCLQRDFFAEETKVINWCVPVLA